VAESISDNKVDFLALMDSLLKDIPAKIKELLDGRRPIGRQYFKSQGRLNAIITVAEITHSMQPAISFNEILHSTENFTLTKLLCESNIYKSIR
jgi:hypothetical protein